ncbi:hypothetical protein [Amycolatopsis sp. NPDC054798]
MTTDVVRAEVRSGGGVLGLAWLTWRQHRWALVTATLVMAALAVGAWRATVALDEIRAALPPECLTGHCAGAEDLLQRLRSVQDAASVVLALLGAFSGVVAVFVAAPLLAREFEQRTYLLVWSQDVTATRWLVSRFAFLAAALLALSGVLALTTEPLREALNATPIPQGRISAFAAQSFNAALPVSMAHVLFGLGLGIAVSAVVQRVVAAMGITLVLYALVRVAVSLLRPGFLGASRELVPLDANVSGSAHGGLLAHGGYADAAGNAIPAPAGCRGIDAGHELTLCLRGNGVAYNVVEYQSGARMTMVELIESALFLVLTVALLAVAWWRVRASFRGVASGWRPAFRRDQP